MPSIETVFKRGFKYMLLLLSTYVIGWSITPYPTVFAGLFLGTSLSLFNFWGLVKRILIVDKVNKKGKKMKSLGTLSRLATAALAGLIAVRYPEYFDLISVVWGLMTLYIVIFIDLILQSIFKKK